MTSTDKNNRRRFGEHLTSVDVFRRHILPRIETDLRAFRWVDMFAGEGNLILPILDGVPSADRTDFFRDHLFLFDVQPEKIEASVRNALAYGIPESVARANIRLRDTLADYPVELMAGGLPLRHITNPPYLYIGYIVKTPHARANLQYFQSGNEGYQDLYQIALMNDLRHGIKRMTYIIPSNFLFSASGTNKIRDDVFPFYSVDSAVIIETKIFDFTGTNVAILEFRRKRERDSSPVRFDAVKINATGESRRSYSLSPANHYRAGAEFDDYARANAVRHPLSVSFYLTQEEVDRNPGKNELSVIDANDFSGGEYRKLTIRINDALKEKILANNLFIRTVDTGSADGRAGLYPVRETFGVDGILVTTAKYRTHPIQTFVSPSLDENGLRSLRTVFNERLERLRTETDGDCLTTYQYSSSAYVRKYFGLSQAKRLLRTIAAP